MPNLEVKFKPEYKGTRGVSEIKMNSSQRMSDSAIIQNEENKKVEGDNSKEKWFLYLFLLGSIILMYFSMIPNKRV